MFPNYYTHFLLIHVLIDLIFVCLIIDIVRMKDTYVLSDGSINQKVSLVRIEEATDISTEDQDLDSGVSQKYHYHS